MFDHWDNNCWLKDYILTIYPFLAEQNFKSNLNKTEQKKDIQIFPDFLKVKGKNKTKQPSKHFLFSKTSSRRLQYVFTKTNVFWESHKFKISSFDKTLYNKHQLREKLFVFGVFLVFISRHLDWIRDTPYLSVFSPNTRKCGLEKLRIQTLFTQWPSNYLPSLKNSFFISLW